MTCREFKHEAASRSLVELAHTKDAAIVDHSESCRSCGEWLQKQRALAASLHSLRAQTASLQAGEVVERALLRVFRQGVPAEIVASAAAETVPASRLKHVAGSAEHDANAASRSTAITPTQGFAWHLSKLFGLGAYAAVAAAIAVAVFLGAHLLRRDTKPAPSQAQAASEQVAPLARQSTPPVVNVVPKPVAQSRPVSQPRQASTRVLTSQRQQPPASSPAVTEPWQEDDSGYTALMFCDPLSCSSETQVVRMELPSAHDTQPQMADVVVGFDGMVRAVRFVN